MFVKSYCSFQRIDSIDIQTTEQVEKYNGTERYLLENSTQVSEFISVLQSARKIGEVKESSAKGDGAITVISKGSKLYGIEDQLVPDMTWTETHYWIFTGTIVQRHQAAGTYGSLFG